VTDEKPVERADRAAAARGLATGAAARRWWRRLPRLITDPVQVFVALRDEDEDDVVARQEPLLAIVLLAGMGGAVITPTWGTILDEDEVDGWSAVVLTFIGGSLAGAVVYFLLGVALWVGLRGAGSLGRARLARQVAGFSAIPIALSLFVTVPVALIAFGSDFFRSGGSDNGAGHSAVVAIGLAAVAWSIALLSVGLRTTLRLPWRGVATVIALAAVAIAVIAASPYVL
jgi:hypothetical protein